MIAGYWQKRYTDRYMALTKADIEQVGEVVAQVTMPMFEMILDRLDGHDQEFVSISERFAQIDGRFAQIDGRFAQIDERFDKLENELTDFKSETRTKFATLEQKIDDVAFDVSSVKRQLDGMDQDIQFLYKLAEKLETGTPAEQKFAKTTIENQLKVINRNVQRLAKQTGTTL